MIIVRIEHGWALGFCSKGMRSFCAKNGIDYLSFCRDGIAADELAKFDDHNANLMIEKARSEQE